MSNQIPKDDATRFDLAAEGIATRIRWFGVVVGFLLVNLRTTGTVPDVPVLNTILVLGVVYVAVDTVLSLRGKVFLNDWPLAVSLLEAVFIGLLCYFDEGQESAFRFYYFLSLVVCAMRYATGITYTTFLFHALSYSMLLPAQSTSASLTWMIMVVSMGWVTWASTRMAGLIQVARNRLAEVNEQLEQRISVRTRELNESQAMLVQQEKQAAFGLLAAGIAHEVGNPLAAISSLVQLLRRQLADEETQERYRLIGDQLRRIQGTLRELVDFSRPATDQVSQCDIHVIVEESLNIAKYYKRRKGKRILTRYAPQLPAIRVVHDELVQVFLNLILNAMDATSEGGTIEIMTSLSGGQIRIAFRDTGHGIKEHDRKQIFQPYFTTKKTGTGLGLFVCRQVLERSSGTIELTSTGESGTTFSVVVDDDSLAEYADQPAPEDAVDHSLSIDGNFHGTEDQL
ncbi:MAG: ATP-binding protein [Planctomycetaceae bacterium]